MFWVGGLVDSNRECGSGIIYHVCNIKLYVVFKINLREFVHLFHSLREHPSFP